MTCVVHRPTVVYKGMYVSFLLSRPPGELHPTDSVQRIELLVPFLLLPPPIVPNVMPTFLARAARVGAGRWSYGLGGR